MKTYDHYRLFTSENRNNWFYNQIKQVCSGKVCMDIGAGSGVLSLFAIQAGAEHVFMIDHNIDCCDMASDIFEYNNISKEKYTIMHEQFDKNLARVLPNIDVIVSEIITSKFFSAGYCDICKIIQDTPSLKNATMIPDKIYGSLTFFKDIKSITSVEQLFKRRDMIKKIYTGVENIDTEYTVLSHMVDRFSYHNVRIHQFLDNFMSCRPYIKPRSVYERIMYDVWRDAIASECYTTDDVIKYDVYNPLTALEWQTKINMPNNIYGIRLNGYLECERTNSARFEMHKDVWATYFYKFTKTNNNLKIQFNNEINDFSFK